MRYNLAPSLRPDHFNEQKQTFPYDVPVTATPTQLIPRFELVGQVAGIYRDPDGGITEELHITLVILNSEWGTLCIDGQSARPGAGSSAAVPIQTMFYYNQLPQGVVFRFALQPPCGMAANALATALFQHAQNFPGRLPKRGFPAATRNSGMGVQTWGSGAYMSGLLQSAMGYVPHLSLHSAGDRLYQVPGWDTPLPANHFRA